jgi:hypothetical protein
MVTLDSFMAAYSAAKRPEHRQAALEAAMEALCRPITEKEPLLNLKQIAAHYSVSITTPWRWALPAVDFRGLKRYRVSECENYLNSEAFRQRRQQQRELRRQKALEKGRRVKAEGRSKPRKSRSSEHPLSSTRGSRKRKE